MTNIFKINHKDEFSRARTGILDLYHNSVETPVFMPVGTNGTVKTFMPYELHDMDIEIILANAYHLYLRPGMDVIENAEGLHKFSQWDKNILTDSGGFQLFSLSSLNKVEDEGVYFNSHIDGSKHFLSPANAVDIQKTIGSDIMMVLDHCTAGNSSYEESLKALEITTKWAKISRNHYLNNVDSERQKQFGIVQGNMFHDLRKRSADEITNINFDGYAIGGLSVGESPDVFTDILSFTAPLLPEDKPRYLMGVGTPDDILTGVANGIDMFDCVFPTRIARNASALTKNGRINLRNNKYKFDLTPLDEECTCHVCRDFSKSYIRHLFKAKEITAARMTSYHNIYFMKNFMRDIRKSIINGNFSVFKNDFMQKYSNGIES